MQSLPLIQSVQNSMVKHAYSLKIPKKSKDSLDFLCEGFHLVGEALDSDMKCRFLFGHQEGWNHPEGQKILEKAQKAKVRCFQVTAKIIDYVSDTLTPQGLLGVVAKPLPAWPSPPFTTVLGVHQVQDAGNLGTLFRSAEAFGVQGILLTEGCCDLFNPKVVRGSMGSLFRIPFMTALSGNQYLDWLKENGFRSYALVKDSPHLITEKDFSFPQVFWVGSEGAGLPTPFSSSCDEILSIPMTGKVESLNVAVAASLAMFWAQLKRPVP